MKRRSHRAPVCFRGETHDTFGISYALYGFGTAHYTAWKTLK